MGKVLDSHMPNGQSSMQLSNRELQVLEMVVTGASNQEIAHKLVISVNTVKVHMRNIFDKMGVQSRTEAGLRAIQEGLVAVPANEAESPQKSEALTPRTYLLAANPPLTIPGWQQIYLFLAILATLTVALLPLLPQETNQIPPPLTVPVIYAQPPTPVPLLEPNPDPNRWATHTAMPTSRAGLALVAFEERIFAMGGVRTNYKESRSVEIYDTTTNSWAEGENKRNATANIAGAVINNNIYVPGGCKNDGQAVKALEIYDPQADSWTKGSPMPEARCAYGLVTFQDKLYLFGGWNGEKFEDTIFVFSPQENIWQVLEYSMPHPIGYLGAAVLDDDIYIVGGYDGQDEFNQTYHFNPETGKWLEKSPLQEKRGGLGLVSSGNNLYAVGGGWQHTLNSSEKYDPNTDAWSSFETPYTNQWRNLGLTIIDTTIYAVGGWDGSEEKFMDSIVSYQFLYQFFLPLPGF
jgi:DNA-binding CsgD family transcriptional regulator/N-acetylneuraminic acid mutarotase